jgi:hypothetical protein
MSICIQTASALLKFIANIHGHSTMSYLSSLDVYFSNWTAVWHGTGTSTMRHGTARHGMMWHGGLPAVLCLIVLLCRVFSKHDPMASYSCCAVPSSMAAWRALCWPATTLLVLACHHVTLSCLPHCCGPTLSKQPRGHPRTAAVSSAHGRCIAAPPHRHSSRLNAVTSPQLSASRRQCRRHALRGR